MNDVLNGQSKTTKLIEPLVSSMVGVLSDISELITPDDGNPFYMLTFTLPAGETKSLPINCKYWDRIRSRYQLDTYVSYTTERRIEGKTFYVDKETGEQMIHSRSGEYFRSMNRIPESLYVMEVKKILAEDLEHRIINQDEASKQNALAVFYSNFYRS